MTRIRHVIYLHGFASSPASSKAQRFARELAYRGVTFDCPDLNEPAFETLTVTRMLDQVRQAVGRAPAGPTAVIGSSLGGFVALHAAAQHPTVVQRVILLAPALEFGGRFRDKMFESLQRASPEPSAEAGNRLRQLGEHGIDEWRKNGRLRVFHYAANEERDVGFALYEDAARYDALALSIDLPILVFQGRHDDSVDPAAVERWARGRANVDLRLLDDGHQLTASMDLIWKESERFLGLV